MLENNGHYRATEREKKEWNAVYILLPGSYVYQIRVAILSDKNKKEPLIIDRDQKGDCFLINIDARL
jgi:hypothetical protein